VWIAQNSSASVWRELGDQADPAVELAAGRTVPAQAQAVEIRPQRRGQRADRRLHRLPGRHQTVDLVGRPAHEHGVQLAVAEVLVPREDVIRHAAARHPASH
jgi:hypothetical protein